MSAARAVSTVLASWEPAACYDELFGFDRAPLPHCASLDAAITSLPPDEWQRRSALAEVVFRETTPT